LKALKIRQMNAFTEITSDLDFADFFNTDDKCREWLMDHRWNGKPKCTCGHEDKLYIMNGGKFYKCSSCKATFSVTSGTFLHGTRISLRKWFYALYIFVNNKKGFSSYGLAKKLKVTQKTAWFMLHRIRHAMTDKTLRLSGEVELDETFVGGKNKNRHWDKKVKGNQGRALIDKCAIYGMVERGKGGRVKIIHVKNLCGAGLQALARHFISDTSVIHTDEYRSYIGIDRYFEAHFAVNHGQGQYVIDGGHTNTIECFWSQLKKGIFGVYHFTSKHLLYRYCHEFEFRWNTRQETELGRFLTALNQGLNKRLSWSMASDHSRKW